MTARIHSFVLQCTFLVGLGLLVYEPGVSGQCSEFVSPLEIHVDWWNVLPYSSREKNENGNFTYSGIFPTVLKHVTNQTGIRLKYNEPMKNFVNFTGMANNKRNNTIYFPVMAEEDDDKSCYIPVLSTNGPAYIIHIQEIVPLTLLGKGLLQGWQVIALTLVLAAISGVFMWLMDRGSNPEDFPPNFFTGVWQGFWWAFVTMTTVGYGDTAPRSVPARLYSILWMIIGMIAFSVLTANITSSLSQKTFDAEEKMFGKRVGVLEGTLDAKAAILENARIINHQTVAELLSSLQRGKVDGILVERYVAGAYYNEYKELGMELGTLIRFPYKVGMQAPSFITGRDGETCTAFKKCVLDILGEEKIPMKVLSDFSNAWQDFKPSESTSLFEDESFFYILIAFFFALLGVGCVWHYFVFIPKQRQTINDNNGDEVKAMESGEKFIVLKTELEMLCPDCHPKLDAILTENPDRQYHDSLLHIPLLHGAPNLKMLSANAFDQLKRVPSNAAGAIPDAFVGRKKSGRVSKC
ncbi:uncharacterized protein LOC114539464 [Dendronephthya gigantea]|uniref:uncharacterized protein LOC114539464 n=1 Tax=Dendronephthya gigantea TaxID=151771 RepID=UPI00106C6D0B|nr:uncharacterized protein LOC114539464 [Dendronephthya gigantea]